MKERIYDRASILLTPATIEELKKRQAESSEFPTLQSILRFAVKVGLRHKEKWPKDE